MNPMVDEDAIMKRIRAARRAIWRECGENVDRFVERARALGKQTRRSHGRRVAADRANGR